MRWLGEFIDYAFGRGSLRTTLAGAETIARYEKANASAQADQLREWEARMTPAEREKAFEICQKLGWPRGSDVPGFVWQDVFRQATGGRLS